MLRLLPELGRMLCVLAGLERLLHMLPGRRCVPRALSVLPRQRYVMRLLPRLMRLLP